MVDFAIEIKDSSTNEVSFLSGGFGFGIHSFPPTLCFGKNREVVFYSYILLIDIITAIGCTLLLIIIWSLHRVSFSLNPTIVSIFSLSEILANTFSLYKIIPHILHTVLLIYQWLRIKGRVGAPTHPSNK